MNTSHRKNFHNAAYNTTVVNGIDEIHCSAILLIESKMSASTFNDLFATYDVKAGARIYTSDSATSYKKIQDMTYDYTMTKPDYKFGDEHELSEEPQPLAGFNKYEPFEMSTFDSSLTGKGFVKLVGDFKMVPNFETLMWEMVFSLEMPKQYFDPTKWVVFYGTYAMDGVADSDVTITCEVKLGDTTSAVVKEYDHTFAFDSSTATSRLTAANAAALSDANGYRRNYDPQLYNLVDSIGGKQR